MTEKKRFHFDYVCGDTGLIDEQAEHQWFIENCCSITDLKKNWKTVCDKLNEVNKENEKLKQEKKEICGRYWVYVKELERVNEMMEDEIVILKTTIARNEAYIERMKHKGEWRK